MDILEPISQMLAVDFIPLSSLWRRGLGRGGLPFDAIYKTALLCRNLFWGCDVQAWMKSKPQRRPVIERVAALAMRLGSRHLADYGAARSRHDFTQRQLMAC